VPLSGSQGRSGCLFVTSVTGLVVGVDLPTSEHQLALVSNPSGAVRCRCEAGTSSHPRQLRLPDLMRAVADGPLRRRTRSRRPGNRIEL